MLLTEDEALFAIDYSYSIFEYLGFISRPKIENVCMVYIKNDVLFIPVQNKTNTFVEHKIDGFIKNNTSYKIYSFAFSNKIPILNVQIFEDEIDIILGLGIWVYGCFSKGDRMKTLLNNLEKAYKTFKEIERNRL
jgi:hypothetical protein